MHVLSERRIYNSFSSFEPPQCIKEIDNKEFSGQTFLPKLIWTEIENNWYH